MMRGLGQLVSGSYDLVLLGLLQRLPSPLQSRFHGPPILVTDLIAVLVHQPIGVVDHRIQLVLGIDLLAPVAVLGLVL